MKNKEILKKAIEKAITNGLEERKAFSLYKIAEMYPNEVIFDQDFAKAFWGEEIKCNWCDLNNIEHEITINSDDYEICSECGILIADGYFTRVSWKTHIREMAVVEDRIKYLEKFL